LQAGTRPRAGFLPIGYYPPFQGFFSPVDNLPTLNAAKAGSAIPVKFRLGGDQGLAVFAAGYPKSQKVDCDTAAPIDAIEETVTVSSSSLSYSAGTGQYNYVWKTDKSWWGTCRQLILGLNDSTNHVAADSTNKKPFCWRRV
jgi:hypothetical protein